MSEHRGRVGRGENVLRWKINLFERASPLKATKGQPEQESSRYKYRVTVDTKKAGIRGWYRAKFIAPDSPLQRISISAADNRGRLIYAFESAAPSKQFALYVFLGSQVGLISALSVGIESHAAGVTATLRPIRFIEFIWHSLPSGLLRRPRAFIKHFFRPLDPVTMAFRFPQPPHLAKRIKIDALRSNWRSIDEFCAAARELAARGDLAAALQMIVDFVLSVILHENSVARVFASRNLDQLCIDLGRVWPLEKPTSRDTERTVYLVTALAKVGGHTRVLKDLMRADPNPKHTVLVSNTQHDLRPGDLEDLFSDTGAQIEIAPTGNLAERLKWLQGRLSGLRPARTYILQHHFDPICIAAAQPELTGTLIYYHNCDHSLALGVHVPHAIHIDFNGKGFYHCRECEGVLHNVIWPLTADVSQHRVGKPFMADGHLTTCTAGGFEKFDPRHLIYRTPYLLSYAQAVATILRTTGGTHIHIGGLHDETRRAVAEKLSKGGIPQDRFVWIQYVPELAAALVENGVDVYFGSFPYGGGRAVVEAMGAGLPLLVHSNYRSVFFSDINEVYPGAFIWRTMKDLKAALTSLSSEVLEEHSRQARRFFEQRCTQEALRAAVALTLSGGSPPSPPRPTHHPDTIQTFLDEYAAAGERERELMAISSQQVTANISTRMLLKALRRRFKTKLRGLLSWK